MIKPIRRVAVLGAGVMGSGIAAHVANAGIPVLLLDIVPPKISTDDRKSKAKRNAFAAGAIKKLLKGKPAAFTHPDSRQLVQIGNFDDDLSKVAQTDLVIEAIVERLDIKRSLFEKLEGIIKDDTIVASNTSGLRIVDMMKGRGEAFRKRFLIMHFFNPPRYMKLLELVCGADTDAKISERVEHFGREILGKGIVYANDTPNFIGNRIGAHAMMAAMHAMLELGLAPEDVDAITGLPMGHPKSATFRTADVVGLDTLAHVVDGCHEVLKDDEDRDVFKVPEYVRKMIADGKLGQKTRGGFYRKGKGGIETLDPKTGAYRARGGDAAIRSTCKAIQGGDPKKRIAKLVASDGMVGKFAWKVLSRSLVYAANRVGEITDDIASIDTALRWGYNWELGPFETWDALGFAATVERLKKDGHKLPDSILKMHAAGAKGFYDDGRVVHLKSGDYRAQKTDPREIRLPALRRGKAAVLKNDGAEAWDLGDGVLGVTFKTKANSLDADNIKILNEAIAWAEQNAEGVLLFNEGQNFCVGANLMLVVMAAKAEQWDKIDAMGKELQDTTQRMKYAHVPVVVAPYAMTLGGGLELCLGADSVQAACETYTGLVEAAVGLIPGGGGVMNSVWRALETVPDGAEVDTYALITQVFKNIAMASVVTSAHAAKRAGYFRHGDGVSFDRSRHLHEAKQRVLGLAASGYHPPIARTHKLMGESGIATLSMMVDTMVKAGYASEHDGLIGRKLAHVLCGGVAGASREITEQEVLDLEREAFISLCGEAKTQDRMQFMLMNNKPLRN